jgi:putative photosynthetic complex assembly protein
MVTIESEDDDHRHHAEPFPRGPLLAAGALLAFTVLAVSLSMAFGDDAPPAATPVGARVEAIRFTDQPGGGVGVYRVADDRLIEVLPGGTNGFLRATLRGMVRDRRRLGVADDVPFELVAGVDDQFSLRDPGSGRLVPLAAFGQSNVEAFARLHRAIGERP